MSQFYVNWRNREKSFRGLKYVARFFMKLNIFIDFIKDFVIKNKNFWSTKTYNILINFLNSFNINRKTKNRFFIQFFKIFIEYF